jgi:hypothetical protein
MLSVGCEPGESQTHDVVTRGEKDGPVFHGTVEQAIAKTCTTASAKPLSQQIIDEMICMEPELVEVPERPNLSYGGPVFPYLVAPARDRLLEVLDASPTKKMKVNSMFRTVAQQFMLRSWYERKRCGIKAAAKPGASNHETGLAIDISSHGTWKAALEAKGFDWFGSKDAVHFDYEGPGATDFKGLDIMAFQRLWNRNNPDDTIEETGTWNAATRDRMKKSPADGFAVGPSCGGGEPSDDWSCNGATGTEKLASGEYVAGSFGCSILEDGSDGYEPGDGCEPSCLDTLVDEGLCLEQMDGPECERFVNWFASGSDRFGCGTKLRVTDPASGRSAIVAVIESGPSCSVEKSVGTGVVHLSHRASEHLFGSIVDTSDERTIEIEEVASDEPVGPAY